MSDACGHETQAGGIKTMRITEANSISGAGMEHVSDKYAAALWQAGVLSCVVTRGLWPTMCACRQSEWLCSRNSPMACFHSGTTNLRLCFAVADLAFEFSKAGVTSLHMHWGIGGTPTNDSPA